MEKKKISLSTIFLVLILVIGLGIMAYPSVSNFWNSMHHSRAIAGYNEMMEAVSDIDKEALLEDAMLYNEHLAELDSPLYEFEQLHRAYLDCLNLGGSEIMGYITIDKIDVQLPIYHGTDEAVLNVGVGHMEGSSLPVGGSGSHSVLSAHRGLPSARLFTDLDKMEVGDTFTITILGDVYLYEVDQILIVEPTQVDLMKAVEGMDYVTLQTCTPYGINSHRLLVRGHRTTAEKVEAAVHSEALVIPAYIAAFAILIPALFLVLVTLVIVYSRKTLDYSPKEIAELSCLHQDKKKDSIEKGVEHNADEKHNS